MSSDDLTPEELVELVEETRELDRKLLAELKACNRRVWRLTALLLANDRRKLRRWRKALDARKVPAALQ